VSGVCDDDHTKRDKHGASDARVLLWAEARHAMSVPDPHFYCAFRVASLVASSKQVLAVTKQLVSCIFYVCNLCQSARGLAQKQRRV
jgi:hypothetical protein